MADMNVNREKFEKLIRGDKPVIADFWAPWCVHCRRMETIWRDIVEEYADRLEAVKINVDEEPQLARQENVDVIPTLKIFTGGRESAKITAPESKAQIDAFIASALESM